MTISYKYSPATQQFYVLAADAQAVTAAVFEAAQAAHAAGLPFVVLGADQLSVAPSAAHSYYPDLGRWLDYRYMYSPSKQVMYPIDMLDVYSDLPDDLVRITSDAHAQLMGARDQGLQAVVVDDGERVDVATSPAHDWDAKNGTWILNKTKQAELDKQTALAAGQARLVEIEQAVQNHINQTVAGLGMGFTDDQSLIGKYAGYDNVFRPVAEAVGKWVAEIWYMAAQDKAAIIAGKKAIPTVEETLAQIPVFVLPSAQ